MWMIFEDTIYPANEDPVTKKEVMVEQLSTRAVCLDQVKGMVVWPLGGPSWAIDVKLEGDAGFLICKGMTRNNAENLLRDIVRAITSGRHQWLEIRRTDEGGFGVF